MFLCDLDVLRYFSLTMYACYLCQHSLIVFCLVCYDLDTAGNEAESFHQQTPSHRCLYQAHKDHHLILVLVLSFSQSVWPTPFLLNVFTAL